MEPERRTDDGTDAAASSGYEPPLVEDLETEGEGATVSVTGGAVGSPTLALAEPTDNPPAADGG